MSFFLLLSNMEPAKYRSDHIVDLTRLACGQNATIVSLEAEQELLGRLMGLGLFIGSRIRLLQGGSGTRGPLLLGVGNTRIALGREVARGILAERE